MRHHLSPLRSFLIASFVVPLALLAGCGEAASQGPAMPAANLPPNAPTGPVDTKDLMKATKGVSNAAYDSASNPALQKGTK
jgi:hypothetical protein